MLSTGLDKDDILYSDAQYIMTKVYSFTFKLLAPSLQISFQTPPGASYIHKWIGLTLRENPSGIPATARLTAARNMSPAE